MEFLSLPIEIQECIYSKLPKKDLLSVSLICDFCNKVALKVLYRQILADCYPSALRLELSFYQQFWNQESQKREYGMLAKLEYNKNSIPPKYSYQKIESVSQKIEPVRKGKRSFSMMKNDQSPFQKNESVKMRKISKWDEFGNITLEKNKKSKKEIILNVFKILSILNDKNEIKLTTVDILNNEIGCGFSDGQVAIIHFDLIKNNKKIQEVKFSEIINFKGHISSISTIKLDHEKCILFSKSIPKLWHYAHNNPIVHDLKINMNFTDTEEIPEVEWNGRVLKAKIGASVHIWEFLPGIFWGSVS